jgi:flagellar protein FliS
MFGSAKFGATAYANVGMETGVVAASPHKLIVMLFDGALAAVSSGLQFMQAGNVAEKGKAISKAISIIDGGLRASLDKKAGGEIAQNLDALYEYMTHRLLQANLNNRPEMLNEVHGLLKDLKQSWESIGEVPAPAPTAALQDPLMPQSSRLVKA